jgi:RNA polymerase sigma-70 factor (ECF subfamily)
METTTGEQAARIAMPIRRRGEGNSPRSELALVRAAQRGSADAMNELVREQWPRAYATALAMLGRPAAASDVAQEAMVSVIRGLGSFDPKRPLGPWVNRIATNRALDLLRREGRRREVTAVTDEPPAGDPSAHERLELMEALQSIEPQARAMVVLRHLGGFNSEEIAEQLDTNAGTVRSTISRALSKLQHQQESEGKVR